MLVSSHPKTDAVPENLIGFTDEAAELLQDIRQGLLVHIQDSFYDTSSLGGPLQKAFLLSSAAREYGLEEVESHTARLEERLRLAYESKTPMGSGESLAVLDLLAKTEEAVVRLRMDFDLFSLDVSEFVDESFDFLQIGPDPPAILEQPSASELAPPVEDSFEIDSELLEIFAMESEDLLRSIQSNLELLVANPENRDALWEIRRNAHTLKGAAGIVGLTQLSGIAHKIEDLLDRLSENDIPANERILSILRAATDHLTAVANGDASPQSTEKVSDLFASFENAFEPAIETDEISTPATPTPQPTPPVEESESQAKPSEERSIIRVPLAKLDDLSNVVRDLIVSRSVFEQRLIELDRQIDELHNCTRRLQNASGKLETDFEASMTRNEFLSRPAPGSEQSRGFGNQFDSLELDRYTDFYQSTRELSETTNDTFAINTSLDALRGNLESLFEHQRRLIEETHERLMAIRLVRFGTLATRIQRSVRVTCEEENKKAAVNIENGDLEIDSHLLESLVEPLMHLLKNAVVHGIESGETRRLLGKPETGQIDITLSNEETHILLQVSDDGRGIDSAALKEKALSADLLLPEVIESMNDNEARRLIFLPGFTTAEKLTLSAGRGVGMSIIKECVEARQGTIMIDSSPQKGTTFTIRVPLNLAVTTVLLVTAGGQKIAIPVKLISHVGEFSASDVKQSEEGKTLDFAGKECAVTSLASYFEADFESKGDFVNVLIVDTSGAVTALVVDEIVKTEEIIIRPIGKPLDQLKGVLGAATLGNGETVAILDVPALIKTEPWQTPVKIEPPTKPETLAVMIVDDSPSVRHMTSKVVESAGFRVLTAKDGLDAIDVLRVARELPQVILTDVEMPRMDGYELARYLKNSELLANIPVVFITSRSGEKHRTKASEIGASEYLTKPFDDAELIGTIRRLAQNNQK